VLSAGHLDRPQHLVGAMDAAASLAPDRPRHVSSLNLLNVLAAQRERGFQWAGRQVTITDGLASVKSTTRSK